MTASIFDEADDLVTALHLNPELAAKVEKLLRHIDDTERFNRLLWLLLADAACIGAKLALTELKSQ